MRKFAGKVQTKKVKFMDGELEIRKLTAGAIQRIGEVAQVEEGEDADDMANLVAIFNEAVVLEKDEDPIDKELLMDYSMDDLSKLVQDIMVYAGVNSAELGNES